MSAYIIDKCKIFEFVGNHAVSLEISNDDYFDILQLACNLELEGCAPMCVSSNANYLFVNLNASEWNAVKCKFYEDSEIGISILIYNYPNHPDFDLWCASAIDNSIHIVDK